MEKDNFFTKIIIIIILFYNYFQTQPNPILITVAHPIWPGGNLARLSMHLLMDQSFSTIDFVAELCNALNQ